MKIKKIIVLFVLAGLFFCGGCSLPTLVSVFGTGTRGEKKVIAEYDLSKHKRQKVLVFVDQPGWLAAKTNLRYYITRQMNKALEQRVGIKTEFLVDYEQLSKYRGSILDVSKVGPIEVAKGLNADVVLLVTIEDFELIGLMQKDYYKGSLTSRAALLDVATSEKLWPESQEGKLVRISFEIEDAGRQAAIARLAFGSAYCTVRYFYNCPVNKFKIADDKSGGAWRNW